VQVLYEAAAQGNLKGLTLLNRAGAFDFKNDEYSSFEQNVQPLRQMSKCLTDIRWENLNCT
jgi:hypothetical protein